MKLSWEDEDNEEDPNNPMDLQSSDEDEGNLYTLTATEKYRPMKVTQTSKKSSLSKHKKTQTSLSKRKNAATKQSKLQI